MQNVLWIDKSLYVHGQQHFKFAPIDHHLIGCSLILFMKFFKGEHPYLPDKPELNIED
jgi:hypothetical protein